MTFGARWFGMKEFQSLLRDVEAEQTPFAVSRALTEIGFEIRAAWKAEMGQRFDRPTPFVLNSALVDRAKKTDLEARVRIRDSGAGRAPTKVLGVHTEGGQRLRRGGEHTLGSFFVPGAGAKLDKFGNLAKSEVKLLASIGAGGSAPASGRGRRRRGGGAAGSRGLVKIMSQSGPLRPGVYERIGRNNVRPIAYFIAGAQYQKALNVYDLGTKLFNDRYEVVFGEQLARAVASAKR